MHHDTLLLCLLAAALYVIAAIFMKTLGAGSTAIGAIAALIALGLAAVVEIEILRSARLGAAMFFIIAFEVALTVVAAVLVFRESYTAREVAGLALIALGMAVVSWQTGEAAD